MANPITPETRVHLLSVPLENNMKATLYFNNASAQSTYFLSKAKKSNTDFTYQRKNSSMVVPYLVDEIYSCNYVMYQNHNFNNKWFYAFITSMEYVDEETTRLYIETDPIQTWWFDITLKECFVEREHAKVDTIGSNLQPEDLEVGEYKINTHHGLSDLTYDLKIVIASSKEPYGNHNDVYARKYNGIFSGVRYYAYSNIEDAIDGINSLASTPSAIQSIFLAPSFLAPTSPAIDETLHIALPDVLESDEPWAFIVGGDNITNLDGYVPHNKKMLTYPFCYIKVSNLQGQSAIFKQELFSSGLPGPNTYAIYGVLTPGCSIRLSARGSYNAIERTGTDYDYEASEEYGINLAKYPICSWSTDSYTNWLTQNGVTNTGATLTSAGMIIGSLIAMAATGGATAPLVGVALAGSVGVSASLHQRYVAELQPPQVEGNVNCGDVMTSAKLNTFHFYRMTIRYNQARIIDKYFDMFGYKTNLVKVPEYNHRKNWWFTKTIDCNIIGDIPEDDMERIKQCFNEGITFWKNPANMYNYDVDNSII